MDYTEIKGFIVKEAQHGLIFHLSMWYPNNSKIDHNVQDVVHVLYLLPKVPNIHRTVEPLSYQGIRPKQNLVSNEEINLDLKGKKLE